MRQPNSWPPVIEAIALKPISPSTVKIDQPRQLEPIKEDHDSDQKADEMVASAGASEIAPAAGRVEVAATAERVQMTATTGESEITSSASVGEEAVPVSQAFSDVLSASRRLYQALVG